jgi:hypothetical protein
MRYLWNPEAKRVPNEAIKHKYNAALKWFEPGAKQFLL